MGKRTYILFVTTAVLLIGIIFFGIYDLVYSSTIRKEEQRIQKYIYNIAQYTAEIIDMDSVKIIADKIESDMTLEEKELVKSSPEYIQLKKQLKTVKDYFSDYVSYIYIITPKYGVIYFVVAGHDGFTEIDQYGSLFDISPFKYLQVAFNEQRPLVEPCPQYDPDYKLYSISAYSPLFTTTNKTFYGLLGIDLELKSYNKLRYAYAFIACIVSFLGLTCMVITTLYISEKISFMKPISKRK